MTEPKTYHKYFPDVEAIQYLGPNLRSIKNFCGTAWSITHDLATHTELFEVHTPNGPTPLNTTDWVIRTRDGLYVASDPVFTANYQESKK